MIDNLPSHLLRDMGLIFLSVSTENASAAFSSDKGTVVRQSINTGLANLFKLASASGLRASPLESCQGSGTNGDMKCVSCASHVKRNTGAISFYQAKCEAFIACLQF